MTKSAVSCGFGHIYWINLWWKTSFFVQWEVIKNSLPQLTTLLTWNLTISFSQSFFQKLGLLFVDRYTLFSFCPGVAKKNWNLQPESCLKIGRAFNKQYVLFLEVFCGKGVLENFANFLGKHLCQGLLFNEAAGLRPAKRDSGPSVLL